MPNQIDLERKDYKADPLPAEPAMHEDGPARLATVFAWLGFGVLVAVLIAPAAAWLRDITWPN